MPTADRVFDSLKLKGRYELREALGRGGMGVVYRAYDSVLKCDVAVKTLHQSPNPTVIELFHRECEILAALNHPNIVPILDLGEVEYEGCSRPYFVMPLLPGVALSQLIRNPSADFTIQRRLEILSQVCRGLNAAHERGLVHRDIKPGNILVMPDYSAEIIDFGVAHMVDTGATGMKGTLQYMAPELIEGRPPTPLSDIFSLGVTAYELFTLRRPFERPSERDTIEAILHETPPPAWDLDPAIDQSLGRVIHKSMAKQPRHRFSTAREFGEYFEMAYRGQPIDAFDPVHIRPRLERVKAACELGDHQLAAEILGELEAEGHIHSELTLLRRNVDLALRQKIIRQLLEDVRSRFVLEEYPLALQKVHEALSLAPDNAEGLALRSRIEDAQAAAEIEGWFRLARQHVDHNAFAPAREALGKVLKARAHDPCAEDLFAEIDRREQEYLSASREKEQLYQSALEAWQKGDVSGALTKLERLLDIEGRAPDTAHPEKGNAYRNLYNQARSEHDRIRDGYSKAREHLDDGDFSLESGASSPQRITALGATGILGASETAGSPGLTAPPGPTASEEALEPPIPAAATAAREPLVAQKHAPAPRRAAILAVTIPVLMAGCIVTWIALHKAKPGRVGAPSAVVAQSGAANRLVPNEPPKPAKSPPAGQSESAIPASPSPQGVPFEGARTSGASRASPSTQAHSGTSSPAIRVMDAADWDKPLTRDGEWWVRQGGNFVLYRPRPTAGTFVFTLRPSSLSSKVQWILDYSDENNYILFQIDRRAYTCFLYAGGHKNTISKKPHDVKNGVYTVKMVVGQEHLTVMMASDKGELTTVQEWTRNGVPFTTGQFGLYYPADTRMWLANFSFTAQPATP